MSEPSRPARRAILFLSILAFLPVPVASEPIRLEPVVVIATRIPEPRQHLGSAVTVIDRTEIEASGMTQVAELLRRVPGVTVNNSGGPGGRTDVAIRGADEDQTLVLVDGVPVNDPASTGKRFDFAGLSVAGIERIEVLRGPQSALYGSDAIGGVLNIVTRRGEGPPSGYAEIVLGRYDSDREAAGFAAGGPAWHLALDAARETTRGFSRVEGGAEDDGASATTLSGRAGVAPNERLRFEASGRLERIDADLDPTTTRDGFAAKVERVSSARASAVLELDDGRWSQQLDVYTARTARTFLETGLTSDFLGERFGVEYRHDLRLGAAGTVSLGIDLRRERAEASERNLIAERVRFGESEDTRSLYGLYQLGLDDRAYLTAGGRIDDFDDFGTEGTYRLTAAVPFDEAGTTVRASYATGAKAPTIQQRFDRTFLFGFLPVNGNPDLGVERSRGWDAGVEQRLLDERLTASVTVFDNRLEDLIEFDVAAGTFVQVDRASTRGVEVALELHPLDALSLGATYTHLDATDNATGFALARRARHTASLVVDLTLSRRLTASATATFVGPRFNLSGEREPLPGYGRLDLAGRYAIDDRLDLVVRVVNVLDHDYQEVAKLATARRSLYAGFRARF